MQGEKIKYSVLLYLACEHMVFGLKKLQRKIWAKQANK